MIGLNSVVAKEKIALDEDKEILFLFVKYGWVEALSTIFERKRKYQDPQLIKVFDVNK